MLVRALEKGLALEVTVARVLTRAAELIPGRVLVCAVVPDLVKDRDLAVELVRAPVLIHVMGLIVAKALVLAQVLVRVTTQTQAIVQGVVLLLILAKFINLY